MSTTTPSCAIEAKAQGWRMVCVKPVRLSPSNLLELILAHFEEVAYFPFTHKDGLPNGEENQPVWVRGFDGTAEAQKVLLAAFFEGSNTAIMRFIRESMSECAPGVRLTRDSPKKPHTAATQHLKRRLLKSPAS